MRRAFLLLGIGIALGGVACSATSSDDAASSEDAYKVEPTDGETLARIKVTTPPGWVLPVNANDDGYAYYRNANVAFNNAVRVKDGDGLLTFTGKFDTGLNAGNVKLAKGTTTTVGLASLEPKYGGATLKRDFGPTPALKVFYTGAGQQEQQVYGQSNSQAAFWNGAPQRPLLAPPGAYRFSWTLPILDDKSKTLKDGDVAKVDLDPSDKRATIVVKKPTARDLPDAPFSCHLPTRTFLVHRTADNSQGFLGEPASYDQNQTGQPANAAIWPGTQYYTENAASWAALPMKADTTIKVFPFAASEGTNHYELVVNNQAVTLALKPGDTKTIQLERLDVDDVEITKETGETYVTKGTWTVYRQGPNNSWIQLAYRQNCSNGAAAPVSFATGTGIDVLPGTYRIVINYTTGEGPKSQDQVVSVP